MKEYIAKVNTGIFPYGYISPGEILQQKHVDALGDQGILDLLAWGVIEEMPAAEEDMQDTQQNPGTEEPEQEPPAETEESPDDGGDAADIPDITGIDFPADDLVGEEEAPEEPKRPASRKNTGGRKAK